MLTSDQHFRLVFIKETGYMSHPCSAYAFALIGNHS
jgi:hypothetical protein